MITVDWGNLWGGHKQHSQLSGLPSLLIFPVNMNFTMRNQKEPQLEGAPIVQ